MTPVPRSTLTARMWVIAGLLMLAEFLVFDRMTSRYHASLYPRWNDQIQYLTEAYTAYDEMHAHGLVAGLKLALGKNAVQGTLHDTAAVVVFWLAGSVSRSATLSLNMLVFLAWQAALLFTIPRVSGSRVLAWMGFGLLLCVGHPWSGEAGSAVDFRLDHGAMCLFGMTSCAALLTEGFRRPGWSLAFGAAVGVTVLERFLSSVYFAGIFAALLAWVLCGPERVRRLGNLGLAAGLAAALILPVFWINREGILNYYWVGHITGAESAARVRGFDFWQSVQFVFGNLGGLHLRAWFGWTVAAVSALLLLLFSIHPRKPTGSSPGWLLTGLFFLLVPAAVLTLHRQKSEIVVGILVPGVVLVALWFWQWLLGRIVFRPEGMAPRLMSCLPAVVALGAGLAHFTLREVRSPHSPEFLEGARRINAISDYIFSSAQAAQLEHPNVGIDRIVDFMDGRMLRVICYERHRTWIDFAVHLPDSILAGPDDIVLFKLKYCDFFLLTNYMPDHGYWPYDRQMRQLYPQLKAWCDGNLELIETFTVFERNMSFYRRKQLP